MNSILETFLIGSGSFLGTIQGPKNWRCLFFFVFKKKQTVTGPRNGILKGLFCCSNSAQSTNPYEAKPLGVELVLCSDFFWFIYQLMCGLCYETISGHGTKGRNSMWLLVYPNQKSGNGTSGCSHINSQEWFNLIFFPNISFIKVKQLWLFFQCVAL